MARDGSLTCVELYAGCGGMALGLKQAGFEHVALVDFDEACIRTLRRNGFPDAQHSRVEDADLSPHAGVSLLAGGPPCQPFSLGGVDGGQGDRRNGWEAALRAVERCRPRAVMFENVAGLLRPKFAAYLTSVLSRLEGMGYHVVVEKVDAAHYGVPQTRRRVFVVGFREKAALAAYSPPERRGEGVVTVREALASLGPPNGENGHAARGSARAYEGHTGSDPDGVAKTVTSGVNGPGGGANTLRLEGGAVRYFTIREAARIQTFPDSFSFDGLSWTASFRQIGNAVPVLLARAFGIAVADALRATTVRPPPPPCPPPVPQRTKRRSSSRRG